MRVFSRMMKDFVDALPWRLAAVAALAALVLGWMTHVDLWIVLARAGGVFVLFWLLGAGGRALYARADVPPRVEPVPPPVGSAEKPDDHPRANP